jgi:hypothetical protein
MNHWLSDVIITVAPSYDQKGNRRYSSRKGPCFDAMIGTRTLCSSPQPLLDTARILLKSGTDPATRLILRHVGSDTDCLCTTVGAAAKLTCQEGDLPPRFATWEPWPSGLRTGQGVDAF